MLPLRFPWIWWGLGWLLVLGVSAGSLAPGSSLPSFSIHDKLLHAAAYCLLMVWFAGLYPRRRHVLIAFGLFLLGFGLDALQATTSTRSFDLIDVAANGSGIIFGLILSRFLLGGWCQRVEQYLSA